MKGDVVVSLVMVVIERRLALLYIDRSGDFMSPLPAGAADAPPFVTVTIYLTD